MHIGFLSFESPFGSTGCGVASYLRAMIPELISAGHRVTLIAPPSTATASSPGGAHAYGDSLRTVDVKLPNAHWYMSKLPLANRLFTLPLREVEWSFEFRRAVAQAMREDPMDVLEVTELGTWCLARDPMLPMVARLHGAEYTFSRHAGQPVTSGSAWTRSLQRKALNHATVVTAPSRFHAAEVAREMHWGSGHVSVVPNVISRAMLAEASERAPRRFTQDSGGAPVILYTGRLAPVKGTALLVEAAVEVLREFPQAEFILAGPWQMPFPAAEWPDWLERQGGTKQIRWVGYQSQQQLAALYQQASVFVMPSFYETFGISCLEAMAFGLPVVASAAGALPEVVEHERVGLTVTPGSRAALANALLRLLRAPDLRRSLGAAGRERVLARYTPDLVSNDMIEVYRQSRARMQ